MPEHDRTLTREDLAQKLKRSVAWTYRNLARLQRTRGFPQPFLRNPDRYSERAVDEWIAAESRGGLQLAPRPRPADEQDAEAGDAVYAALLDENARRLAAAG